LNGQDKQLERAVEEMLKPLNNYSILGRLISSKKKRWQNYLFFINIEN
jgi:hypothetical protein